ncbi:hypothetical protein ES332_D04G202100v1 [Gossypium tomentosum]|uniref:Uncharacterized protein n=1 Tax=Gossypium tomentosum TaxID=34277 RepID=A0A5D2LGJ9_GOSTO|nr:hypothetical protein ES332_D04G202100v1 [Gossypium tomentosum]
MLCLPPFFSYFQNQVVCLSPVPIHLHRQDLHRSTFGPPPNSRIKHLRVCLFPNRQVEASIQERGVWYRLADFPVS